MARQTSLRASDADRERVVDRLRQAASEGRLDPDELEQRVHVALRSRTYGELQRLLADLPSGVRERRRPGVLTFAAVGAGAVAMLVVAALVLAVVALLASAWMLWVLLWFGICMRRGARRRRRAQMWWIAPPPRPGARMSQPMRWNSNENFVPFSSACSFRKPRALR
jgi:uncharacterized protein DUF1707